MCLQEHMGLSQQQSLQKYGTVSYTGWGESEAQADFSAKGLQAPVSLSLPTSTATSQYTSSLTAEVDRARNALKSNLASQQAKNESEMAKLRERESEALEGVKSLVTPFREDLETSERERLYINENFEENQKLTNELESLLTEGNELIKQQREVTGLSAIRNPRIEKTMSDVAARTGVIEAVINARNSQIAQAYNMIDRSINAITQDKIDQLSYYETVLNLTNRDIISLDEDSKRIAQEQTNILKSDLNSAQATVDYVKQLLVDPNTASLMGEAGVTLNDSVEQINAKMQDAQYRREVREQTNNITLKGGQPVADPTTVPAKDLMTFTDSRGETHYYKMPGSSGGSGTASSAQSYVELKLRNNSKSKSSSTKQGPRFTPDGGKDSLWTDPATGIMWLFTLDGWIPVGQSAG